MLELLRRLNKPEYLMQPTAVVRRLGASPAVERRVIAPLPWGVSMEVDTGETIGRSLWHRGLFEMAVVEAMFRLIDPGEAVLDVGANIGFMTVAAASSAPDVEVTAFEPHPELFAALSKGRDAWVAERPALQGRIRLVNAAVSDRAGSACLHVPSAFDCNQGIATLQGEGPDAAVGTKVDVDTVTLDDVLAVERRAIGLLKIDIEGHELAAFLGAERALRGGTIRDIVFEDHEGPGSGAARFLADCGYSLFFLGKLPWRPLLCDPAASWAPALSYDSPNFLATRAPRRARARMAPAGYRCLSRAARRRG
jgi:FkbM family methyltransferase